MVNLKMSVIAAQPPLGYGRRPCRGPTSLPAITGKMIITEENTLRTRIFSNFWDLSFIPVRKALMKAAARAGVPPYCQQ